MPATRTSELAQAIVGLCKSPQGRSTDELVDILDRNRSSVSVYVSQFIRDGLLFRGGVVRRYRFFVSQEDAAAYTVLAEIDLTKQKEATADRQRAAAAARMRKVYEAERRKREAEKKAEEVAKPVRIDLAMRDSGLVIATKQQGIDQRRAHMQANVVWPENVKVTIIPTGVDTRFMAFVEPGKGQISRDWMANRKLSART
jgi:hypothetical protein